MYTLKKRPEPDRPGYKLRDINVPLAIAIAADLSGHLASGLAMAGIVSIKTGLIASVAGNVVSKTAMIAAAIEERNPR